MLAYNNATQTFPSLLIAGPAGFRAREFFAADRGRAWPRRGELRVVASRAGVTLQQQIRSNRMRTALVVLAFAALIVVFAAASAVFVGRSGAIGLLAFGLAYGLFAWWNAGRMIGSLTHATPLQKSDDPELYRLIENVSIAAGLARHAARLPRSTTPLRTPSRPARDPRRSTSASRAASAS